MKKLILILALFLYIPTANTQVLPQQILDEYKEYMCMFVAVYHEARNQKPIGQTWVAGVIINRTNHKKFPPDTICGIVKQHKQFSNIDETFRKLARTGYSSLNEETKGIVANTSYNALYGFLAVPRDIYYYHTVAVRPHWSKVFKKAAIIGSHVFYRH